jgi:CheY-like chemotaxis protein
MPGLDGYELATALRQLPGGNGCLLVAITGWGQQADQDRAREAGYDAHLVKPVEINALFRLIDRVAALA